MEIEIKRKVGNKAKFNKIVKEYKDASSYEIWEGVRDNFIFGFIAATLVVFIATKTDLAVLIGYLTYYSSSSPSTEGPEIIYTDGNGAKWSSKYGAQTGSYFNVTKSQSEVDAFGYPYQIVEGDFSCKLYSVTNPQPNQYLQISYGQFMLNYVKP